VERNAALEDKAQALAKKYQAERLGQIPETLREDVAKMLETPADKRTAVQTYLAENSKRPCASTAMSSSESMRSSRNWQTKRARRSPSSNHKAARTEDPRLMGSRGKPAPTYIYRRGDYLSPGRLVGPGGHRRSPTAKQPRST